MPKLDEYKIHIIVFVLSWMEAGAEKEKSGRENSLNSHQEGLFLRYKNSCIIRVVI